MTESRNDSSASSLSETEKRLEHLYTAVSKAQVLGYFKGHHGPLEETAWVHVAIHQLEELEAAAETTFAGDVRGLSRLRKLIESAPPWKLAPGDIPQTASPGEKEKTSFTPRRPALAVAAAVLLDRLQVEPGHRWAERAAGYYAIRALAITSALEAAEQVHSSSLPLQAFAERLKSCDCISGGATHGHHPVGSVESESGHGGEDEAGHTHSTVSDHFIIEPEDWTPLAVELGRTFYSVIETSVSSKETRQTKTFLQNFVRQHPADETVTSHISKLGENWQAFEPAWKKFLDRPKDIIREPVVEPGPDHNRCVPGQPQHGGQWEIAELVATKQDELCPPAQELYDLSGKIYGKAGAELIKAQNEWIEAKQCYDGTDTKKCIREEDHGYDKCTEERDEGYDDCARREDHGHSECCDWAPCSWFCDALVWFVNLVCVVWEWISNIVCVVWTWFKKIVCVAWDYVMATLCAIGHLAAAAGHAFVGAAGIFAGITTRAVGNFIGDMCNAFGVRPATHTSNTLQVVGVHIAALHTNKVLLFSYDEGVKSVSASNPADFTAIGDSSRALCALWDPQTKTARYIPPHQNLFCAHQSFTEHGHLIVAGGQFPLPGLLKSLVPPRLLAPGADKDVHRFDPLKETWTRLPDMRKGRWYPTAVTLPSGKIFVCSGTNGYATEAGLGRGIQDTWQIMDPKTGNVGAPKPFGHHLYHLYPFMHVLPSGKVFIHFKRTTILFDPVKENLPNPTERVASGGRDSKHTGETQHPYSRTGPGPGTCCLLPLIPKKNAATGAVEYPGGRILILGGGGAEKEPEPADPTDEETRSDGTTGYNLHSNTPATNSAEILDFAESKPAWKFTEEFMRHPRVMPDSILLPNGKVLVVGGGRTGQSGGLLAHFTSTDTQGNPDKGATDPVLEPEMFDPETETWSQLCPKPLARLYHTTAVLLPDARVLVAGHDGALNMPPYDQSRYELEIFSPPYLFGSNGQPAPRPGILSAPAEILLGQPFEIRTPNARNIASVALIRQSSTTHQINSDQRFVGLAILDTSGDRVRVQAPPAGGVAPPGFYMLFILNSAGTPSLAHWSRVPAQE